MPKAPRRRPISVVLSHSSFDRDFAQRLRNDLRRHGAQVWMDDEEIKPGDSLLEKIAKEIHKADFLITLLTKRSIASTWVRREISLALNRELQSRHFRVIPLLLENCRISPSLRDKLFIDFRSGRYLDSLRKLIASLGLSSDSPDKPVLNHLLFFDLINKNTGFDAESIEHHTGQEFLKVIERASILGIKIQGVEAFSSGTFVDVEVYEEHRSRSGKNDWCRNFVGRHDGPKVTFSATYNVPARVMNAFGDDSSMPRSNKPGRITT